MDEADAEQTKKPQYETGTAKTIEETMRLIEQSYEFAVAFKCEV